MLALLIMTWMLGAFDSTTPTWSPPPDILRAKMVSYVYTIYEQGVPGPSSRTTIASTGATRFEGADGQLTVRNPDRMTVTTMSPHSRSVSITRRHLTSKRDKSSSTQISYVGERLDWLRRLNAGEGSFCGWDISNGDSIAVWALHNGEDKPIYSETLVRFSARARNVQRVESRELPNPKFPIRQVEIWTGDFALAIDTLIVTPVGRWDGNQGSVFAKSEFEWSATLDSTLFVITPPADYSVKTVLATPDESDVPSEANEVINGLTVWAEATGGKFPERMDDLGDAQKIRLLMMRKYRKRLPLDDMGPIVIDAQILLRAIAAIDGIRQATPIQYDGNRVVFGDGEDPLCWWQSGQGQYTIIYGDLHASVVPAAGIDKLRGN